MLRGSGMKKLSLLALAAATIAAAPAFAQTGNAPLPPAPPPGTTFQTGTFGNFQGGTFPGGTFQGGTFTGGTFFPGFPTTIQRGFIVPPMFLGPQFAINNWQNYGFAQPSAGQRWIRYYNDAYLIDGDGRVVDTRSGLDWDQYGDRWATQNGIPHYVGRGEFRPDQRDYAWVQQHGAQAGYYGAQPGYGYSGNSQGCGSYTYGYGCGGYGGYGVAYPIIIETVTYGGGCCTSCCSSCCEEVVEEVVEEVRYVPRRPVRRPVRRAPPRPRPPAGERG